METILTEKISNVTLKLCNMISKKGNSFTACILEFENGKTYMIGFEKEFYILRKILKGGN